MKTIALILSALRASWAEVIDTGIFDFRGI